jgi:ATP-binding cassette subfamily B protein
VVIDQGRIVASGSHRELIRADGLYARLAELQFVAAQELTEAGAGEGREPVTG